MDLCKDCVIRGDEDLCERHRLQGICPISDTWVIAVVQEEKQALVEENDDLHRDYDSIDRDLTRETLENARLQKKDKERDGEILRLEKRVAELGGRKL